MKGRVPPLRESGAEVPRELEAIVTGLLEPDPKRRIGDAGLLAAELARMAASRGWRWTLPALNAAAAAGAVSDVPHAQVLTLVDPGTQPAD